MSVTLGAIGSLQVRSGGTRLCGLVWALRYKEREIWRPQGEGHHTQTEADVGDTSANQGRPAALEAGPCRHLDVGAGLGEGKHPSFQAHSGTLLQQPQEPE